MVQDGKTVKVHYTLTVDGGVVDTSKEREPLSFAVGSGQTIPGFERSLIGMNEGEKKAFEVAPDEGYGQPNPDLIQEMPKENLPGDIKPEEGMVLYGQTNDGRTIPLRISSVKENSIVVDLNHPLAGKTLYFEVEVMEVT